MGNDEAGATRHQPPHGLLNVLLGAGVHAAGCFIEDQNAWIGKNGASDCQQLPLPLAQIVGALRQLRLVALWQAMDELIGIG